MDENFDLVAIGDLVTDAFIKLQEAEVHCDIKHDTYQICMNFADKIPYESVTVVPAVGNSPNASVAAARLGLRSALVSSIGDDRDGDDAIATLTADQVNTRFVKRHVGMKTNYHYVLWYNDDRTILIKHESYPYTLPDISTPKWVYLSSLGSESLDYHYQISRWLENNPQIKLAFQPGTFQIRLGHEKLADLYRHTEIFFCNVEEARKILKNDSGEISDLLRGINSLGPKIAVITDGPKGAYAYQDGQGWFMPAYPDPKPPFERTGAGDAFSSTMTTALALGKTLPEALAWGPINSMAVVQDIGAQRGLLTRGKLESLLAAAPPDYRVKQIF